MPHKLYMCCDSNNCECGRSERGPYGGSTAREDRQAKRQAEIDEKIADITTEELRLELNKRDNEKTRDRISSLEAEIKELQRQLK